jgi:hypothetical protein
MKYIDNSGLILTVISSTKDDVLFKISNNNHIIKEKRMSVKNFEKYIQEHNFISSPIALLSDIYDDVQISDFDSIRFSMY